MSRQLVLLKFFDTLSGRVSRQLVLLKFFDTLSGAAADFLSRQGYSDRKIAVIWDAIALHTTPSVPQRKQPEIALLQLGAGIDIGAIPRSLVTPESVEIILAEYPRLGYKKAMLAAMGAVIRRKPMSGVINLMGEVGRERDHLPIPGFCDVVMHAEFDE